MNNVQLRENRKRCGFTQEKLAERLGVSKRTIINYEHGEVIPSTKDKILKAVLEPVVKERATIITDKIFNVINALKASSKIRFYADVYHVLDMDKGNFNAVKNRNYDFTVKQLLKFINNYKVNANYVFKNSSIMFDTI